jgi:CDGSH-type Zn-finger protein
VPEMKMRGRENGPYVLEGRASYIGPDGTPATTSGTNVALCRCGQSCNKPSCDATHRKVGFRAPAVELTIERS